MLQPQNYPRMLGQALVLEPDPFVEMADDDNPWIEGLFLTVCVGVLIALAHLIGSLLFTASLPNPEAVLEAFLQSLRQGALPGSAGESLLELEQTLRRSWPIASALLGYGGGWTRLLLFAVTPLALIGQWLVYGLLCHVIARGTGGEGSLGQTLGVVALSVAPQGLHLLGIVPFVSVSGLLVSVWGVLIAYRGLEVAHDLTPGRAAFTAVAPLVLLAALGVSALAVLAALFGAVGGGL